MIEDLCKVICPCLMTNNHCSVCQDSYHIFCNKIPHGTEEQAYQYFISHPEITKSIQPIGQCKSYEKALQEIQEKENTQK